MVAFRFNPSFCFQIIISGKFIRTINIHFNVKIIRVVIFIHTSVTQRKNIKVFFSLSIDQNLTQKKKDFLFVFLHYTNPLIHKFVFSVEIINKKNDSVVNIEYVLC